MPPKKKEDDDPLRRFSGEIDAQLKFLTALKTNLSDAVTSGSKRKVIRCRNNLETKLEATNKTVLNYTDELVRSGVCTTEDALKWSDEMAGNLAEFEDDLEHSDKYLRDLELEEENSMLTEREKRDSIYRKQIEEERQEHEKWVLNHKLRLEQQFEEFSIRSQKREEEWYKKRTELEEALRGETEKKPQSVKLQKYTISKFNGDYKDWLRFWNQFTVEVDGSKIPEISKFNYLLELVEGKPKEDILGLPHNEEGYATAKTILKETYGKDFKVHKALIQELESLPALENIHNLNETHGFYNKLARIIRTLTTMKRITTAEAHVYTLMDKLGPVREVLVQGEDKWEEWKLNDLVNHLRKYVDRNPEEVTKKKVSRAKDFDDNESMGMGTSYGNLQYSSKSNKDCVYCNSEEHKTLYCMKVLDVARRREILQRKQLCFNCTGFGHVAAKCRSRGCIKCQRKHHTSLCQESHSTLDDGGRKDGTNNTETLHVATGGSMVVHPTVMALVDGVKVRVMLDSGAGSSYVCTGLVRKLNLKHIRREKKHIEQLYGTVHRDVEIYKLKLKSVVFENFTMNIECVNAEKEVLTTLPDPQLEVIRKQNSRLRRLTFSDDGGKDSKRPVHIILGAADYQRIKTTEPAVLGQNPDVDPGAELTMLGWTLFGKMGSSSSDVEQGFLANSSRDEFSQMCSLEVLGIVDTDSSATFHEDFKDRLHYSEEHYYSTRLPWKKDRVELCSHESLAHARLHGTTKKLERDGKVEEYDGKIRELIRDGVLECIPVIPTGNIIHYIPHHAVLKEESNSTKLRIVCDCSARKDKWSPSLNDCLETGPSLQPLVFDILVRNRMKAYCIMGDLKQAFLQIRIDEQDRDALRILWYNNLIERKIIKLRFTRALFGAAPCPYILGATLQKHCEKYEQTYPETVKSLKEDTYVDDIQAVGDSEDELRRFKDDAKIILGDAGFTLHKWQSNIKALEEKNKTETDFEPQSYANSTMAIKDGETKILGLPWNKETDEISIEFASCVKTGKTAPLTKRKILSSIHSVFDVLGIASPLVIVGKMLYAQTCIMKLSWDEETPDKIQKDWCKWIRFLSEINKVTIPRCVSKGKVVALSVHGFSDASKSAISCVFYAVSTFENGNRCTGFLLGKSRIARADLSIPRLELVAAHMLCKIMQHLKEVFSSQSYPIDYQAWIDSTTVLYWLEGEGCWAAFVRNRTNYIRTAKFIQWRYVPTEENPSDVGSRGTCSQIQMQSWLTGPHWLSNGRDWPKQPDVVRSKEIEEEEVKKPEFSGLEIEMDEKADSVIIENLKGHSYWKLLRITAYILRFITNCRKKDRLFGCLKTEEISSAENLVIKHIQRSTALESNMDLKKGVDGIWRCHGRVPNYNPIFIPKKTEMAKSIIWHYHKRNLHGGVASTMSSVREKFWIPLLRSLTKSIIHKCNSCKRYRVKPCSPPKVSPLPEFRTEFNEPFSVTGVDFAGPLIYKTESDNPGKCYVALFTCATIRAVYLKLCPNLTAEGFQRVMKEFVARRGPPHTMVSDNAKTFVATGKWIKALQDNSKLSNYLASQSIKWKFNLSRAPWWGGIFERLIGIMKSTLSKVIGRGWLRYEELEEVLLDVECSMNNRPLCYPEEDMEYEVLTPNLLLRGRPAVMLDEDLERINSDQCTIKRLEFVKKCKEHVKKRWMMEYVRALEERAHKEKSRPTNIPPIDAIVLVKEDVKDKAQLRIARVEEHIKGNDDVIRGVKLRLGNGYLIERPMQLVCNLEIGAMSKMEGEDESKLKKNPKCSRVRTQRSAKMEANERIRHIATQENQID